MKNIISLFLLVTCTGLSFAQSSGHLRISGEVVDSFEQVINYGIVALYKSDSIKVDEILLDNKGRFEFDGLKADTYELRAVLFEKESVLKTSIVLQDKDLSLGKIRMNNGLDITEVTVTSYKPPLVRNVDHLSLNVEDSYLAKSNFSSVDLLNLLPFTDASDEQISIKNSGNILYLIDGKGNRLSNYFNKRMILNFTVDDIERIEIYTNPPARFDASGSSVLNVITKKNVKSSYIRVNSMLGLFQNTPELTRSFNLSGTVNYKIGKFGLFINAFANKNYDVQQLLQRSNFKALNQVLNTTNTRINDGNWFRVNYGLTYEIDDESELSLSCKSSANLFGNPSQFIEENDIEYLSNDIIDSTRQIRIKEEGERKSNGFDLGYWRKHADYNLNIQASYQHSSYNNSGNNYYGGNYYDIFSKKSNDAYSFSINFQDSLFQSLDFSTGIKFTKTFSEHYIQNQFNEGDFNFNEGIGAIYAQVQGTLMGLNWQMGLRAENTDWEITAPESSLYQEQYLNLFPSLFLTKSIKNSTLSFSYTRRLQRPYIEELNPLFSPTGNQLFSITMGDYTKLRPTFYNSFELGFNYHLFSVSSHFTRTKNYRVLFPEEVTEEAVIYVPQSVKFDDYYGLDISVPIQIKTLRIRLTYSGGINHSAYLDGASLTTFTNILKTNLYWRINDVLSINGGINYYFKNNSAYMIEEKGSYSSGLGISYNKADFPFTFSLEINNPIPNNYNFTFDFPLLATNYSNISNRRQIGFSIKYKFKLGKEFDINSFDHISR